MNKLLTLIATAFSLSLSGIALAAGVGPNQPAGSGPNPFSDCGIGAALFKDVEWAAVTSNIIWDLGTTAVTSATVSPQTCSRRNIKAAMMVRDAYAQIVEDAARGQGEHLTATLGLFSCERAQQNEAAEAVRADVLDAVSSPDYREQQTLEKAGTLFNIIDRATRLHCAV
ncbi:DUF3015 family protein [Propionivibrio dicarboxylicus]|uniref:DUF3015 domain-containing protein n=1 Tax=Propionivibrio dicarboxylicus TaxID=83767 RepID=A0A1G8GE69_9RHOO|nr:DUF3015 family protein [Propionivibrio dicarboxylicus]SDH92678.1 Protein of unknown function [Propionivibrio dicarboxylicus]